MSLIDESEKYHVGKIDLQLLSTCIWSFKKKPWNFEELHRVLEWQEKCLTVRWKPGLMNDVCWNQQINLDQRKGNID